MKRILVVLSLVGFVGSSAFAGEACETKACCASKKATAKVCPVGKANQQAKGAAGSIKEHARASKAVIQSTRVS